MTYGVFTPTPDATWPSPMSADAVLDYSWDVSSELGGVAIGTVSVSAQPSGAGELVVSNLSMTGSIVTAFLSGGVAGRQYTVKIDVAYGNISVYSKLIGLTVAPILAKWPLPDPPTAGFGAPLIWSSGVVTTGAAFANVATGLVGAGSTQAAATLLSAAVNIASSGVTGGGFILPSTIVSGTINFTNDWTDTTLLYPPIGAQIDAYGVNVPVAVASGGSVEVSTNAPASQWFRT